jgi:hypothetical protein
MKDGNTWGERGDRGGTTDRLAGVFTKGVSLFSKSYTHAFRVWLCEVHCAAQAQKDWYFSIDLLFQQIVQCVTGLGPSFEACPSPETGSVGFFASERQGKKLRELGSYSKPDSGLFGATGNDPMDRFSWSHPVHDGSGGVFEGDWDCLLGCHLCRLREGARAL